jgi:fructose-specific phosphotransferase system component IIB
MIDPITEFILELDLNTMPIAKNIMSNYKENGIRGLFNKSGLEKSWFANDSKYADNIVGTKGIEIKNKVEAALKIQNNKIISLNKKYDAAINHFSTMKAPPKQRIKWMTRTADSYKASIKQIEDEFKSVRKPLGDELRSIRDSLFKKVVPINKITAEPLKQLQSKNKNTLKIPIKSDGSIGAVEAIAAAAIIIAAAYIIYKRFLTKAARACKGKKFGKKNLCMNIYKKNALAVRISNMKANITKCKNSTDLNKCKEKVSQKLKSLENRLSKLNVKIKNYK